MWGKRRFVAEIDAVICGDSDKKDTYSRSVAMVTKYVHSKCALKKINPLSTSKKRKRIQTMPHI